MANQAESQPNKYRTMVAPETVSSQPNLINEDLTEEQVLEVFWAFNRSTSNVGAEPRQSSLKFLIAAMHGISSLIYFASWQDKLIKLSGGFDYREAAKNKERWVPTHQFKEFREKPRKLDVQLATRWMAQHIKRSSPDAACSRETVRQVMGGFRDLGVMEKEPRKFGPSHQMCGYKNFDLEKALTVFRVLESLYWMVRQELEAAGKEIIELPRHMFRLSKDIFQWFHGIRFNSRRPLDKGLMNSSPEEKEGVLKGEIELEISSVQNKIAGHEGTLGQAGFLGLAVSTIKEIEYMVEGLRKRGEYLGRQLQEIDRSIVSGSH